MILHKKELYTCFDLSVVSFIRERLDENHIPCECKTIDLTSPNILDIPGPRAMGSQGINPNYMKQYILYVKSKFYDEASFIIRDIL